MLTDYFNRVFEIGQAIVYPRRQGSNMWLVHGIIIGINGRALSVQNTETNRISTVTALNRCVIVDR